MREHGGPRSGLKIVWAAQSDSIPEGHTAVYLGDPERPTRPLMSQPRRHRTASVGVSEAVPRRQASEEVQEDGDSPAPKRQAPLALLGESVTKT